MEIKVGSIVKDKRDGRLFEVLVINGVSGVGRPLDPADLYKNDEWVIMLNHMELVLEEVTDAFDILFKNDEDKK